MKTRTRVLLFLVLLTVWLGLSGSLVAQPTVTNLSFSPPTTISTFPATVTINFTITGSGVYYFATALQDPTGNFINYQVVAEAAGPCATDPSCRTTITPGSTVTGSVPITISQFATPGTWQVAYVFALDANGFYYKTTQDGSLSPTSPFPNLGTLTVNSTLDTTPPNITALSFTNAIITTSSAVNLGVNYTVTDAGTNNGPISGAASVYVGFLSPSGGTNRGTLSSFTPGASVTGTLSIPFPQMSEPGVWTISDVIVSDAANNTLVLDAAHLAAPPYNFQTTLTVTSTVDTTPPTLCSTSPTPSCGPSLSFSPTAISTAGSPVFVSYSVADELSGVNNISILLTSPSGAQQQSGSFSISPPATAFTSASSPVDTRIALNFPSASEQGTWAVSFVLVSDAAGNTRLYKPACSASDPPSCQTLASVGAPATFTVNPPGTDTTPPIITSTVNPLPNGAGWNNTIPVTVTWTEVDPESGIASTNACGTSTVSAPTTGTTYTCSATNGAGLTSSASVTVKIDTAPPVVSNGLATPDPVIVNNDVTITATITDTGGSTVASAGFRVDGGPLDDLFAVPPSSFGTNTVNVSLFLPASTNPLLQTPGVHSICIQGTDFADNVATPQCVLFAVYDPNGGFATGGGGTNSLAGADPANPNVAGPVTFAFNPKYVPNNNNVPQGNLEFHFDADNIIFKASSWDFLVITNGNRAQAQGTGTLNGSRTCKFSLDAWDNSFSQTTPPATNVDALGFSIFNCDGTTGTTFYNLPTAPITKGNIVVHAN